MDSEIIVKLSHKHLVHVVNKCRLQKHFYGHAKTIKDNIFCKYNPYAFLGVYFFQDSGQGHKNCICIFLDLWAAVVIFTATNAQRGKAPSNVNSLTSPQLQPTPSTSRCPLLPVSLSGPWQTLWSGLLSAACMFVCSLSHLVAWHCAPQAPQHTLHGGKR